jgi:glutathione peroxidase
VLGEKKKKEIMFRKIYLLATSVLALACASSQERPANAPNPSSMSPNNSFYQFKMKTLDGKLIDFQEYKGKKVLLVNTASKCGYTPQYTELEQLWDSYKDKNVVVLGFPANNFMAQEPGTNDDIMDFCQKNYGVSFPVFEKIDVTGDKQHPLFKWLSHKDQNGWNDQAPSWNFCKYIINEKGELIGFYPSKVKPLDKEIVEKLQ